MHPGVWLRVETSNQPVLSVTGLSKVRCHPSGSERTAHGNGGLSAEIEIRLEKAFAV
jgi:hypothetical protein